MDLPKYRQAGRVPASGKAKTFLDMSPGRAPCMMLYFEGLDSVFIRALSLYHISGVLMELVMNSIMYLK
jgi:hypothetical protein